MIPIRFRVIESIYCIETKQIRFLRCNGKKWKRIKKFNKNPKNFVTVPMQQAFVVGDTVICHPAMAHALREEIRRQENQMERGGGLGYGYL